MELRLVLRDHRDPLSNYRVLLNLSMFEAIGLELAGVYAAYARIPSGFRIGSQSRRHAAFLNRIEVNRIIREDELRSAVGPVETVLRYTISVANRSYTFASSRFREVLGLFVTPVTTTYGSMLRRATALVNKCQRVTSFVVRAAIVGGVIIGVLMVARSIYVRRWRRSAMERHCAPLLLSDRDVVVEELELDARVALEDGDPAKLTENEIATRLPVRFVRRCSMWCKANFNCTPEDLSAAQYKVVREGLQRELRQRNVRNALIAVVLDAAVTLAFIPSSTELEAAKLLNSDLFKARRAETAVAKQSWWSFQFSRVYGMLGHQGAIKLSP